MKIILAPDSFKGTFTSKEMIQHFKNGIHKHFTDTEIIEIPIADGGEGTVDAIISCLGGKYITKTVSGPLGKPVEAKFGIYQDTAVIEMAEASGITLLSKEEKNPLYTSTYGTGELILEALNYGVKEIVIGIGGSATNDGGMGMAKALGVRFLDQNKQEVEARGSELGKVQDIDMSTLDPRLKDVKITTICDVDNPLTGQNGATYVYGPQKGASPDIAKELEDGMIHYSNIIQKQFNIHLNKIPGTGAAGGLGAGLIVYLNASLKPGIETILDLVDFDQLVKDADLVITGEGRLDGQSINGKVPVGIGKHCMPYKAKVIALAGSLTDDCEQVYDYGIDAIFSTVDKPYSLEEVLSDSEKLLIRAIDRMLRLIKIGMEVN